jgi:hypothetical protein
MYRRHSAPLVNSLDILAHAVNGVRDLEEVVLGDVHRRCELRRDLAQLRADDVVLHTQKKISQISKAHFYTDTNSEKTIYIY